MFRRRNNQNNNRRGFRAIRCCGGSCTGCGGCGGGGRGACMNARGFMAAGEGRRFAGRGDRREMGRFSPCSGCPSMYMCRPCMQEEAELDEE